jgi:epoxyqueuosine reductase
MTAPAGPLVSGAAREELRGKLQALGFEVVRFAAATQLAAGSLRNWIAAGMHADMAWIERTVDKRNDPAVVLPGARSVIMLGVNYWHDDQAPADDRPRWARYALHEDYHDTIKPALAAAGQLLEGAFGVTAEDHRYYVDTGPVLERGLAARSGL